jgi:hypothetical protein
MLMVLMVIGFARNLLSVVFGIKILFLEPIYTNGIFPGFYSMRPDIVFTMTVAPVFLCFFGALILSLLLRLFNKQRGDKEVLSLCFHLQIFHLLVPFLDILNFKFDIPYYIQIFPASVLLSFMTHLIVMTVGIIAVWILSGVAVIRFLKDICRISPLKIFLIIFLTFNLLFWPIYMLFPFSNYLVNHLLPIEEMEQVDDFMRGTYDLFYGYAVFFLLLAVSGIVYFRKVFFKSKSPSQHKV